MSDELKPCPFCGSKPSHVDYENGDVFFGCASAVCEFNPNSIFADLREAHEAWNKRLTSSATPTDAAQILEEIRNYLVAAADGSMSRNNSEQLASELLERINA